MQKRYQVQNICLYNTGKVVRRVLLVQAFDGAEFPWVIWPVKRIF